MKYKVEIKDLGANRVNLVQEVEKIDYDTLLRIVRPHLLSSWPDFYIDENGEGTVFAGFHRVGKIKVIEVEV